MRKPEYLKFKEILPQWNAAKKKTKSWEILSVSSGVKLGEIHWYSHWRQYVFYPSMQTLWNTGCLYEISKFLDNENAAHREALRMKKVNGI